MRVDEYRRRDALELASLIARGETTAAEVAGIALELARDVGMPLGSVVRTMDRYATTQLARGLPAGPLRGVPFLLKDLGLMVAGEETGGGSRFWRGFTPSINTTLTERYLAAGLVFVGKTATPELGLAPETCPVAHGPCRNPWDETRSAGGSSGGAAAAVAAGVVPVAHATDGGGSIRLPASNCGLVGLKPTRARLPMGPVVGEGWGGLATGHVVSRTVRDCAAFLDATHGPAPGDPYRAPPPSRPWRDEVGADPGRLRVALALSRPDGAPVHPDVAAAVTRAARLLEGLGHHVEEARFDVDPDLVFTTIWRIVAANVAATIAQRAKAVGRAPGPDDLEPYSWGLVEQGRSMSAEVYVGAIMDAHQIGRRAAALFQRFDLALHPVWSNPPLPLDTITMRSGDVEAIGRMTREEMPFTPLYNLAGLPGISLPLATSATGLPIGVHLGADAGREDLLLRVAAQLEQAAPWADRWLPLWDRRDAA